jgi:hypothetical protein
MASRDTRQSLADDQSFRTDIVPLLDWRHGQDGLGSWNDDLERGNGEFTESRQSSFELTDPPFEQLSPRSKSSWPSKLRRYVSLLGIPAERWKINSRTATIASPRSLRFCLYLIVAILMILSVSAVVHCIIQLLIALPRGVIQFISLSFLTLAAIFPNQAAYFVDHWGDPGKPSKGLLHWPTDFSRDIQPVPCHSHNDYWRKVPLYSALQAGCIGVEADVWLIENELYIGHSKSSLAPNRTLKSLYISPLLDVLARQNPKTEFHPGRDSPPNGVFDTDSEQTLVLLIDFKTDARSLWPYVYAQLDPLREAGYLTHFDGTSVKQRPITVVATGNAPFDLLTSNSTYRDIFYDAPLDRMSSHPTTFPQKSGQGTSGNAPTEPSSYNITNSYYASTSLKDSIGSVWSKPSTTQLDHIRSQIKGAHERGLKARYWETPAWPRGLRNHVWNVLVEEGVDFLNVDDLKAATEGTWGKWG